MARKIEVQIVGDSRSLHRALGDVTTRTRRFGSVLGTSFRAGSVLATGALVGLGFAAKDLFQDFSDGQKATAQTRAVIHSTGGAANVTTKHVQDLATTIQGYSGIQDDVVQSGENMLLTFKNIHNEVGKGNDVFDQSTKILADMSTALGEDMPKAAIQLGKALNDPIKGITALQRVGVTFTDGQKKAIDAMVKSGNTMGAQKTILKELRSEFGGSARAAGSTFAGQMNILRGAFENAGSAIISELLPYVTRFARWAIPLAVKAIHGLVQGIIRVIRYFERFGGGANSAGNKIHGALNRVVEFFRGHVMPIVRRLEEIFRQSFQKIGQVVQQNGDAIHRIAVRLGNALQAIAKVAIPILRFALVVVLPKAIGISIKIIDRLTLRLDQLNRLLHHTGPSGIDAFNAMVGPIQTTIGWVNSLISKIQDLIGWINRIPALPNLGTSGIDILKGLIPGANVRSGPNVAGGRFGGMNGSSVLHVHLMVGQRELGSVLVDADKLYRRQNAGRGLLSG